ncbi:protein phosphatase 2C [Helicosporidium sp. ATCC 50920]|nr:protein phosphatase 2C [Helicosporidium sp. ATCC 50920]|eukprot:KDD75363.1 protein phosphatase 2C [Helicosporidium sp. ATCC 50920]
MGCASSHLREEDHLSTDPSSWRAMALSATSKAPPNLGGPALVISHKVDTRKGCYPNDPDRPSEDAYCAVEELGGHPGVHLYGVFDGHGPEGRACSSFVAKKLPEALAADSSLMKDPSRSLVRAIHGVDSALRKSRFDDIHSGCTACVALVVGDRVLVGNVGDSRAVAARVIKPGSGELQAEDLSEDHTPFRKDEFERVTKAGAFVMTLEQLEREQRVFSCYVDPEGFDGDPPRLWDSTGVFPGTAFTRSIGDHGAAHVGIVADAEIKTVSLSRDMPMLLLATDGIWEFVSSQRAMDIMSRPGRRSARIESLVEEACRIWMEREGRTDDIAVVAVFFDVDAARRDEAEEDGVDGKRAEQVQG